MKVLEGRADASNNSAPYVVFDALQAASLFILVVTVVPALLSTSVRRMKTWFALMASAMAYCISFLLLLGRQSGPEPPFALCLYQAGLIYAAPPTLAASAMTFTIELYWRLSSAFTQIEFNHPRVNVLLFVPPLVHINIFFLSLFNGLSHPSSVERVDVGMYCHVDERIPTTVTGVVVVILLVVMFLIECYTISYIWQRRTSVSEIRLRGSEGHYPLQSFVRVTIYTLVGGFSIILVDLFVNTLPNDRSGVALNMLAVIPLSIAILFGSQMDIVRFYSGRSKARWTPPE